jgi:hypothetical protein
LVAELAILNNPPATFVESDGCDLSIVSSAMEYPFPSNDDDSGDLRDMTKKEIENIH